MMQQKARNTLENEVQKEVDKREKTIREAKKFKVENHSKRVFKENKQYL